jgi:hypothetical protein
LLFPNQLQIFLVEILSHRHGRYLSSTTLMLASFVNKVVPFSQVFDQAPDPLQLDGWRAPAATADSQQQRAYSSC